MKLAKYAGFDDFARTWNGKTVRVSNEGNNEGRFGFVTSALKRGDEYKLRVAIGVGAAATTIVVDASGVGLERPDWERLAPDRLDYRVMTQERRAEFAVD